VSLSTIGEWLDWIANQHSAEIELGLERIKPVAAKLGVLAFSCPVITVGGTNGKGSTVAGLEAIYAAAQYRVGSFTSPILFKHNEQVKINGQFASDDEFCAAFEKVEQARQNITLTPFEYQTLAALLIFKTYALDVLILEVGLGGRLDAVNIIDADVSVVTSIALDHVAWLGTTREAIAFEKAGIFRSGRPAICGDVNPPSTLLQYAKEIGATLYCQTKDFYYEERQSYWSWSFQTVEYNELPKNMFLTQNMSTVLMAITLLQNKLPVKREAIDRGLATAKLLGRIQVVDGSVTTIFDVSHNPAAVAVLATYLKKHTHLGKTRGVFSMLADKDIATSINVIRDDIDEWYVAPLQTQRTRSMEELKEAFFQEKIQQLKLFTTIVDAFEQAKQASQPADRIIVFGSFHTVAEVMKIELT
jgi:dihydrofolate synthase/folylpolyglutamate synthase